VCASVQKSLAQHDRLSARACSATLWDAEEAGQFSSASLLRNISWLAASCLGTPKCTRQLPHGCECRISYGQGAAS
jgi:hypothetical protein